LNSKEKLYNNKTSTNLLQEAKKKTNQNYNQPRVEIVLFIADVDNLNKKLSILEGINPRYNLRKICNFELQLHFELKCRIYLWVKIVLQPLILICGPCYNMRGGRHHPTQPWLVSRK
jgi:hypothetical protein